MLKNINYQHNKQQIINDFNSRTDYDKGRFYTSVGQRLVELAHLQSGQRVLDVATGTGIVALTAAKTVSDRGKIIGIDISAGMLAQAQAKLQTLGLTNVELIEADIEEIDGNKYDLSENSFDFIFCSLAICYFADIPKFLQQSYRLLKPGGTFAFNAWETEAFLPSVLFRKVASRYGVEIPNPNEFLGSPHKCYSHVYDANFQDIKIFCEDFGWSFTPNIEYAENIWNINTQNLFGHQILLLPEEKQAECKAEFIQEIQSLSTSEHQAWCNALLHFVIAKK